MHFQTLTFTLSIITSFTPFVLSADDRINCLKSGDTCTLYMNWPNESPSLQANNFAKPRDFTLFAKDCTALSSTMEQPTDKGPLIIKSPDLKNDITVTGMDSLGRPLFDYEGQKGGENCGAQFHGDSFSFSCAFACER